MKFKTPIGGLMFIEKGLKLIPPKPQHRGPLVLGVEVWGAC